MKSKTVEPKVIQEFYEDDTPDYEAYYLGGKLHNEAGPAARNWHEDGTPASEAYWLNGKRHNETGPAFRSWHKDGTRTSEVYYLNGKLYSKAEWEAALRPKPTCAGQTVVIEGVTYRLEPVKESDDE